MSEQIDMTRIFFTDHAIDQFLNRTKEMSGGTSKDPDGIIRKLLSHAEKEPMNTKLVKRIINHNCEYVEYWLSSGWRFIITEEDDRLIVVTIERNKYK